MSTPKRLRAHPMTEERVIQAFFGDKACIQNTTAILCESHPPTHPDPVTQTLVTMIASPLQIQLTAVGWQPFKGKELTLPYQSMNQEQKEALKTLMKEDEGQWNAYEYATVYRRRAGQKGVTALRSLDVLEALCDMILKSAAYPDRRVRVAVCNILLQRVQASIPVDKNTLRDLNSRLFTPAKDE